MLGYTNVTLFTSGDQCSMRSSSRAVTSSPASADAASSSSSAYLWWAMTSIVLGGYISVLTSHIMNMVLPKMMSDLGTDVITIRWVVTAYMIANAVVMPLSAWLARTLGARGLSYFGMDSTYASSLAILRRVLRLEGALE